MVTETEKALSGLKMGNGAIHTGPKRLSDKTTYPFLFDEGQSGRHQKIEPFTKQSIKINQMLAAAIRVRPNLDRTLKRRGVDDAVRNLMRLWLMRLRWQCGGVVG